MEKACSTFPTSTCTGPAAMVTEMVDIPCKDPKCPTTPTVTVTGPGKCFHCQSDCGTETVTKTVRCPTMTAPAPVMIDSFQIKWVSSCEAGRMVVILESWTLRMSMTLNGRSALSGLGFQAWWSAQKYESSFCSSTCHCGFDIMIPWWTKY